MPAPILSAPLHKRPILPGPCIHPKLHKHAVGKNESDVRAVLPNPFKKSEQAKNQAMALAQQLISQYPQSDWSARGQTLLFLVQGGVPTYGNVVQ
jgi:hypothetical protein